MAVSILLVLRNFVVRVFYILIFLSSFYVPALDMPNHSEQYYLVQGLFEQLAIEPQGCNIVDDYVNFACGQTNLSVEEFSETVDNYIKTFLIGLSQQHDWFQDSYAYITEYTNDKGQYYFAVTAEGFVIIAFTPHR